MYAEEFEDVSLAKSLIFYIELTIKIASTNMKPRSMSQLEIPGLMPKMNDI